MTRNYDLIASSSAQDQKAVTRDPKVLIMFRKSLKCQHIATKIPSNKYSRINQITDTYVILD